ncbi:MAG: hypothetical protein RBS37_00235 [Bacteroidales bacterium]|jgi:hypothetical protein|nr:hypothetical protein [Bacteroidales bacterium]
MNTGIYYLAFIVTVLYSGSAYGQSKSVTPLRDVIVISGDTVIKATVLSASPRVKYDNTKRYYWYGKGLVLCNIGGSGGKLLHGNYQSFTDGRLVVSGAFSSGLKDGVWSIWNEDGALISQENWQKGEIVVARNKGKSNDKPEKEKASGSNSRARRDSKRDKAGRDA